MIFGKVIMMSNNKFIESLRKNYRGIVFILVASLLTAIGQLFWKISNGSNVKFLFLGFLCYGLGAVLMIIAFRYGSFSVIHPMISAGYIFAIIFGRIFLKENLSLIQLTGIFVIMLGVAAIGGGDA